MNELVGDEFLAEKATTIRALAVSAARDLAEIGKHLNEVKERFGRGDNPKFLAWALDTLGWSQATVYRYLRIFEFSQTGDFINVDKIDLDVSSLYLLVAPSTTDEARAEVIEQAKTTKKVTRAVVKKTVARHAKPNAKKAAPAAKPVEGETIPYDEAVREGRLLVEQLKAQMPEEFEEPRMLVEPDAAPPTVHVDAAPGDVMVEHLRAQLAARDEEIEQLKSYIDAFKVNPRHDRNEIVELRAARAALEDRVHRMETARAAEFAAFLLHYCWGGDTQTLMEGAREYIPEVFEALERGLAARQQTAPADEPAPPTQPVETGV